MQIWGVWGIPHLEKEKKLLGLFTSLEAAELAVERLKADQCTKLEIIGDLTR